MTRTEEICGCLEAYPKQCEFLAEACYEGGMKNFLQSFFE